MDSQHEGNDHQGPYTKAMMHDARRPAGPHACTYALKQRNVMHVRVRRTASIKLMKSNRLWRPDQSVLCMVLIYLSFSEEEDRLIELDRCKSHASYLPL